MKKYLELASKVFTFCLCNISDFDVKHIKILKKRGETIVASYNDQLVAKLTLDSNAQDLGLLKNECLMLRKFNAAIFLREGYTEGLYFILMNYVLQSGASNLRLSKEKKQPTVKDIKIYNKIAKKISSIHLQQYVHGDLNPGNFIINYDTTSVEIIDWSLCHKINSSQILYTGMFIHFASPELASMMLSGKLKNHIIVDPRSEVYSLAATILYFMISAPPTDYNGKVDIMEKLEVIATEGFNTGNVLTHNFFIPDWLLQALSFDPVDRPTIEEIVLHTTMN